MSEFKVRCEYVRNAKKKFFNDKEPREYHQFSVTNPEIIPDEHVNFTDERKKICFIWISDDLVKEAKIEFGNLDETTEKYKFIINLEGDKTAKFTTNNKNWMVLKTKDYLENTIKKIGFWDSEDYFYESNKKPQKPTKNPNNNPTKPENKNDWGKIVLICLPIIILAFFFYWLFKWMSKKNK